MQADANELFGLVAPERIELGFDILGLIEACAQLAEHFSAALVDPREIDADQSIDQFRPM